MIMPQLVTKIKIPVIVLGVMSSVLNSLINLRRLIIILFYFIMNDLI